MKIGLPLQNRLYPFWYVKNRKVSRRHHAGDVARYCF